MKKTKNIGRYRLVDRVGSGGMGVVYDAVDTRTDTRVALKVLLPHAAEAAQGLLRFKREFRALARLRHKNIVKVFDAGLEDNVPFIAMEFIEGKNIRDHLTSFKVGKERDSELIRCILSILGALSHIHSRRIVHRDLKPENILVSEDGTVKLMDFGVARVRQTSSEESGLLGTFAYMAPEVVTTGQVDGRSDLYALGVIVFELVTGQFPFPVEPPAAALHHHVNTPPQLVRHLTPNAAPVLAGLTHALLEKDPIDRPSSANEAVKWFETSRFRQDSLPDVSVEMPGLLFVPRFVGRGDVLEELEGAASDASAGRGQLFVLEGPTGMGKSRLVTELRLRIRRRTHILVGVSHDRTQSYGAIEPILDGFASIATQAQREVAQRIVGPDVSLVGSISPKLASLGQQIDVSHLEPKQRKIRLHKTIIGILGRLALTRSVVLVVEDIQNSDNQSLELLWDMARTLLAERPGGASGETVCPVSIILTHSPDSPSKNSTGVLLRRLRRKDLMSQIVLRPLDKGMVAEILGTMTGVRKPLEDLVEKLVADSEGRPDRVQECVHEYVRNRELVRENGIWSFQGRLVDTSSTELRLSSLEPAKASAVNRSDTPLSLPQRLNLSEGGYALLEEIAVLGRVLTGPLITAVSNLSGDDFLDAMDELVRKDVMLEELDGGNVHYRFAFEGLRKQVLESIVPERRRIMHGDLARKIERSFRLERDAIGHVLARHYRRSDVPVRAAYYLLKTSEQAALRGDLDGALTRLSDAVELYRSDRNTVASNTRIYTTTMRSVELLLAFGKAEDALKQADVSLAENTRSPPLAAASIRALRARCQFQLGQFDEALVVLGRLPHPIPNLGLAISVLRLEGEIRVARGEYEQARANFEAARAICTTATLGTTPQEIDVEIAIVKVFQGEHGHALDLLKGVLPLLQGGLHASTRAKVLGTMGQIYAVWDLGSEALSYFRQALELVEARGLRSSQELWSGRLGAMLSVMDDVSEAQRLLKLALRIASEDGNLRGIAEWEGQLGIHWYRMGDLTQAGVDLSRSLAVSRQIGYAEGEARALVYLGAVSLEKDFDEVEHARRRIRDGLERALDFENLETVAEAYLFLARASDAAGEALRAQHELGDAERYARRSKNRRLISLIETEGKELALDS